MACFCRDTHVSLRSFVWLRLAISAPTVHIETGRKQFRSLTNLYTNTAVVAASLLAEVSQVEK